MGLLLDRDGMVALSPSKLALLACPRRARDLLQRPEAGGSPALALGQAAHAVLARLLNGGWPGEAPASLPGLAEDALRREWARSRLPQGDFAAALADLCALLARAPALWQPADGADLRVELPARLEDRKARVRLFGRLDVVQHAHAGNWLMALDWKTGNLPSAEDEPPLAVIAQAALGRLCVGPCPQMIVRHLYLRTSQSLEWAFSEASLAEGWRRVREAAAMVLADDWPPRPGDSCAYCQVTSCEYASRLGDAETLGLAGGD